LTNGRTRKVALLPTWAVPLALRRPDAKSSASAGSMFWRAEFGLIVRTKRHVHVS